MPKNCSSKRVEKQIKNQNFLRKILELKTSLFSQFSPTVIKETKKQAWNEVHQYAINIGIIGAEKDIAYVRNTIWPNLRSRTVSKIDQSQKRGRGGTSDSKIDDTDKLVLEIIGKESPVIVGIGVSDSMESTEASGIKDEDVTLTPAQELSSPAASTTKRKVLVVNKTDSKSLNNLKIKKLRLEIRKLESEVWEKEQNLNIPHCNLTDHIDPLEIASVDF